MDARDFDLRRDGERIGLILSGAAFRDRPPHRMRSSVAVAAGLAAVLAIGGLGLGLGWHRAADLPPTPATVTTPVPPTMPSPAVSPSGGPPAVWTIPPPLSAPAPAVAPSATPTGKAPVAPTTPVPRASRHRWKRIVPVRIALRAAPSPHVKSAGAIAEPLAGAALRAAQDRDAQRARELNRHELERIGGGRSG